MAQEVVSHSLGIRYVETHSQAGQAFVQTSSHVSALLVSCS